MNKLLLSVVAVFGLLMVARLAPAADDAKTITGVLIDNACGARQMSKDDPQAAAASHPKACCSKEGCAKSGYAVISGKKLYKFDDKGNELAKDYLGKDDTTTQVTVEGTVGDDNTIAVKSIKQTKKE